MKVSFDDPIALKFFKLFSKEDNVLIILSLSEGLNFKQIAEESNTSLKQVRKCIKTLETIGLIEIERKGINKYPRIKDDCVEISFKNGTKEIREDAFSMFKFFNRYWKIKAIDTMCKQEGFNLLKPMSSWKFKELGVVVPTNQEIGDSVGVSKRTIDRYFKHFDFENKGNPSAYYNIKEFYVNYNDSFRSEGKNENKFSTKKIGRKWQIKKVVVNLSELSL